MFSGSMVALVTPMAMDGSVDYSAIGRLVEMHLAQGTSAIIAAGSTGESGTLTHKEKLSVIRYIHNTVGGKVPVIAGTGAVSTQDTIELTLEAEQIGVDACLIMAPPYVRPTQEGLYQHYKAIAAKAAVPQILYNVPSRTACDLLPETVARLAGTPNIVGIKEATGSLERAQQILERCGDKLDIYSGDDATGLALMEAGAKGVISITTNLAPKLMQELCKAALAGEWVTARAINDKLMPLHQALCIEANPIPSKWALHLLGWLGPTLRLPLTPLSEKFHEVVRQAMIRAELL